VNRSEITALLAMLNEVYPRRIGSGDAKKTVGVWTAVLADAPPKPVLAAAVAWIRSNNPHPPSPGQLLESLEVQEETPEEAWGQVRREMQRVGYTGTPELTPRCKRAIEAVGGPWETMCRTLLAGEVVALRARFLDAYKNIEARDQQHAALAGADEVLRLAAPLAQQYRLVDEESGEGGREPA
jgi:hypothetical protein